MVSPSGKEVRDKPHTGERNQGLHPHKLQRFGLQDACMSLMNPVLH